jgi:hypothetical protein
MLKTRSLETKDKATLERENVNFGAFEKVVLDTIESTKNEFT